jgi:serine/threonine protein kinase
MSSTPDILPVIQRRNPEREFEILKQIGSGTYGEVFKAKVMKTLELVALKIIKIEPGEDFNIIQQEIQILSDCKHQNIVGYYGSYLSSGYDLVLEEERRDKLWIAMEFCGGGSLQDIYHGQSIQPPQTEGLSSPHLFAKNTKGFGLYSTPAIVKVFEM